MDKEINIEYLISQLTLEEKISLLAGADMWHTVAVDRLGIPGIKVTDGPNGARGVGGQGAPTSACFPVGTALGATWNVELVKQVGQALGQETKSKGAHFLLAPTTNIHRTPIAGRNFECYSEDPYLTARLAVAYIKGVQSEQVGACIKHFICNEQEYQRFSISSDVQVRAFREIYLPPFKAAVEEAGVWAVMSAYNKFNGTYCSANKYLLIDELKTELGFDGLVISDWYGTYGEGPAANGLDLEMPGPARWMGDNVLDAVRSGQLPEEIVNDKVRRILLAIQRCGAFDHPTLRKETADDDPKHRALARLASEESIVLLKNENNLLPLVAEKLNKIAIIGFNAKWAAIMGGGSSAVTPHYKISPLEAMLDRLQNKVEVGYEIGEMIYKSIPTLDTKYIFTPDGSNNGMRLEYFDNTDLDGEPVWSETVEESMMSWFGYAFEHFDPKRFSARMTAKFTAPESGIYTFGLLSSGYSKFMIDGEVLINLQKDKERLDMKEVRKNIHLTEGEVYEICIEFKWEGGERWRSVRLGCQFPLPENLMQRAIDLAQTADVAIVFAGLTNEWESEGFDRPDMKLPCRQDELIFKVAAANPNTVVMLTTGSPVEMPWLSSVPAVIQSWYGGQEVGNAVADVLLGDVNPSGKLPTTYPSRLEDNPTYLYYPGENGRVYYGEGIFVGYRYFDKKKIDPLFPFGFGLSYTSFSYQSIDLEKQVFSLDEEIIISVTIQNIGDYSGKEVVQLYVRDVKSRLIRPEKELKRFTKIYLKPGETQTIYFSLSSEDMSYFDDLKQMWVVEPGMFEILVGGSSRDLPLKAEIELSGDENTTEATIWN